VTDFNVRPLGLPFPSAEVTFLLTMRGRRKKKGKGLKKERKGGKEREKGGKTGMRRRAANYVPFFSLLREKEGEGSCFEKKGKGNGGKK